MFPAPLTADSFRGAAIRGLVGFNASTGTPSATYFDDAAATGAKIMRVAFTPTWDGTDYVIAPGELTAMDAGLAALTARSMYAMLVVVLTRADMPSTGSKPAAFRRMYQAITTRYLANRTICFDLLNEPDIVNPDGATAEDYQFVRDAWNSLASLTTGDIRAIDPGRCIVFEPAMVANPTQFQGLEPLPFGNVAYSPHFYDPFPFTHQNVTQWLASQAFGPGLSYDAWARQELRNNIAIVARWRPDLPKVAGEFSAATWAPDGGDTQWVAECMELMEAAGISWLYHVYRASPVWDAEAVPNGQADYTRSSTAPTITQIRNALALPPGQYRAPPWNNAMSLTFSSALGAALAAATTKAEWVAAIVAAVGGAGRTVTCRRATTGDAWADGTTFRAATLTGSVTTAGGSITSFGNIGTVSTQAAADLASGTSVLRIASADGNAWVQGTLGLPGSGADWTMRVNPTANNGFAFGSTYRLTAPASLPGQAAPGPTPVAVAPGPEAPAAVEIWDWTNPASPALAGTIAFNEQAPNLTFEDQRIQAETGAVLLHRSTQSVIWDGFEWGALRFAMGPEANETNPVQNVYQVLVHLKPHNRWSGWPAFQGHNTATDSTIPRAFRALLKNGGGATIHTWETSDGKPLNAQTDPQRSLAKRFEPYFNCAQQLFWQSARIKLPASLNTWHPGIRPVFGSIARDGRQGASVNGQIPLRAGRFEIKSSSHFWAAPKFGLAEGQTGLSSNASDPHLFSNNYSGDGGFSSWLQIGWGYEPGHSGLHCVLFGPGGGRIDRSFVPTPYALLATDKNYLRPKDSVPIRELAEAWAASEFNECYHYVRNVRTGEGVPKAEVLETTGGWSYAYSTYYGQNASYVPGGAARNINMFSPTNDAWTSFDKDGRRHFNGYGLDFLHNYNSPADAVMLLRSPAHAAAAKQRFDASVMCQLGSHIASAVQYFGTRQQAWAWMHYVNTWIVGSTHYLTYSRAQIEAYFQYDLERVHDQVYARAVTANDPAIYFQCLRNLGYPMNNDPSPGPGGGAYPFSENTTLWAYIAGPIMRMRVSGLWDVMRAKSPKCATAMDWMLQCLIKFTCTSVVATNGRFMDAPDRYDTFSHAGLLTARIPAPFIPASWAAAAALRPPVGAETMVRTEAGALRERSGTMHLFAQMAYVLRDHFPELLSANPDIEAACDLWDGWYTEWRTNGAVFDATVIGNAPMARVA